ncbi:uncharacterized protein K441DRAFT_667878 [Cenococcum geophilum 1.58]|uniref:uncharacterized protein n=1 Tax=Cenococcum geophilum 1.58 TaxID=794803 RepID=UPI00358DF412|nr:hypothetical protein K441DRAFT_667878 [Cenococcum geophilum 1.58]
MKLLSDVLVDPGTIFWSNLRSPIHDLRSSLRVLKASSLPKRRAEFLYISASF